MPSFGRARAQEGAASLAPAATAALFAALALASLAQGLAEFALPVARGGEPFALTRAAAAWAGAAGLFASILLHNVGLALLVPGCGILASRYERSAANRRLLAPILVAALAGAVLVGIATVLLTASREALPFLLALGVAEGGLILSVALSAQRHLHARHRTRLSWSDAADTLRQVRPALAVAVPALAALAALEAWYLL